MRQTFRLNLKEHFECFQDLIISTITSKEVKQINKEKQKKETSKEKL